MKNEGFLTKRLLWAFAIQALLFISFKSFGQKLPEGPQVVSFFSTVDDSEQPYGLYLPKNFDEQKKYPLIIMLHGAGSNHRLSLRRVFGKSNAAGETDVEATRYFPAWADVEYIVASPNSRGTAGYQGIPEKDVYDVLEDVKKRFLIDEDRVYLTGLSMGGGGTLWLGLSRPDIWAAIAPVCPAPPEGTEELLVNGSNLPMHFFHGEADPVVPVSVSRDWVKNLKNLGAKVEYKEFPEVQHDSWVNAYDNGYIFTWFSQFKRDLFPDHVQFASGRYKYNTAYWVQLDRLVPGSIAKIDAKFTGPNTIQVTTSNLEAFTLKVSGHPGFNAQLPSQLVINGKKLKVPASDSISLKLEKGKWIVGKFDPPAKSRQKGAEGPISEAIGDSHIYVYGTEGNPSEQELRNRMDLAVEAANWAAYRGAFLGRVTVFPRVLADKEVRESDKKHSNLILFGTKETNLLIKELENDLPMHLKANNQEIGLVYIYPNNGKYVVISSGLPWWRGFQPRGIAGLFPVQVSSLFSFKDYLIFQGNTGNIISEGYFDNNWQLNESDKGMINSVGAVSFSK